MLDGIEKITGIRPEFEEIDLTDGEVTRDFFARHSDIRAVIHFAALKAVGESVNKPLEYYFNNLNSLMNVLTCMRNLRCRIWCFPLPVRCTGRPMCCR